MMALFQGLHLKPLHRWGCCDKQEQNSEWSSGAYSIAQDTFRGLRKQSDTKMLHTHHKRFIPERRALLSLDRSELLGTSIYCFRNHHCIALKNHCKRPAIWQSRESEWAIVDYQQLQQTRLRRVSSTRLDGFEVLDIRFRLRCFRADLATNAHCSLAAVLLFIMEGVGPPRGCLSFRTELRHRFTRFHNLNDFQITNHTLE
jgi:hypothetical protein